MPEAIKVGYARVSTHGQTLDVQKQKLQAAGCARIYAEKVSGATRKERTELEQALRYVREGDTLVVTRLDRLARSVEDLVAITRQLERDRVNLLVTDMAIDTGTPTGKFAFYLFAAVAEFERSLIQERAQEGRLAAKAKGVKFGRKPSLTETELECLRAEFASAGINKADLAKRYGISRQHLYRLAAQGREEA